MPISSSIPPIDLPEVDIFSFLFNRKDRPFPDDKILSNLAIRPEIRFDYAEKPFFDGGTDHYQWTFGIDAYFVF